MHLEGRCWWGHLLPMPPCLSPHGPCFLLPGRRPPSAYRDPRELLGCNPILHGQRRGSQRPLTSVRDSPSTIAEDWSSCSAPSCPKSLNPDCGKMTIRDTGACPTRVCHWLALGPRSLSPSLSGSQSLDLGPEGAGSMIDPPQGQGGSTCMWPHRGFWDATTISTVASEGMSACPWGICH